MLLERCNGDDGQTIEPYLGDTERLSLCELLDRVLNKGVVIAGHATISVADIDLIYLGLQLVLTSIESAAGSAGRLPAADGAKSGDGPPFSGQVFDLGACQLD